MQRSTEPNCTKLVEEICNVQLKIPLCAYVKYDCQWADSHETQTNLKQTFVKNIWTEFYKTLTASVV